MTVTEWALRSHGSAVRFPLRSVPWRAGNRSAYRPSQVLSGETRFLRIRAYPEKIGAAARFCSISAHYRTVQYILYFSTFVLLLLLLFYGPSVKFQMLNLSKFVSLAIKFQIFDLSKFVSLAYCCKMQAHSTMRGKRPKIIDVDLLSDVSSPKCHSPKSPRFKEEELDDIEEMQVEAQVEEDVMGHVIRLYNGPNGLEKHHGGAKLPRRDFWQPCSEKKNLSFF